MRLGIGISLVSPRYGGSPAPTPTPSAAISSVNANGWSAEWTDVGTLPAYSTGDYEAFFAPDAATYTVPVTSDGFNASGAATTYARTLTVTRRVRQPYTNNVANTHLLGSTATVALSNYVCATDVIAGVTNSSTLVSPVPIAQWADRNRKVCGSTLTVQFVAFHWSGVKAARLWLRDSGNTKQTAVVTVDLTTPVILAGGNDKFPVLGYEASLPCTTWTDTTAIADGTAVIVECEVYPKIGVAASIRTTVGGTVDGRGFTPRTHYKHAAKASSPPYVYVAASGGTDETVTVAGVGNTSATQKVSTTAATARANPFATIKSALEALKAATNLTGGFVDGCIVRMRAGTYSAGTTTASQTYHSAGEVIIETDPEDAAYGAIYPLDSVNYRQMYLTFRNLAFSRTTGSQLGTLASGRLAIVNCTLANGSQAGSLWTANPNVFIDGLTVTDVGASTLINGGASAWPNLMRGVQAGTNKSASAPSIDGFNLLGCRLHNMQMVFSGRSQDGMIAAFWSDTGMTVPILDYNAGTSLALVQYVAEWATDTIGRLFGISPDSQTNSIGHFVHLHGTLGGAGLHGRDNSLYNEGATGRTHTFVREVGVARGACSATKHDWFYGANAAGANPETRVGGWPFMYSTGCVGNFYNYTVIGGIGTVNGNETRAYFGRNAKYGLTEYAPYAAESALYVSADGKATKINGAGVATAGTGGVAEDYQPASGSPLIGMLPEDVLPYDLFGAAREQGTCGAIEAEPPMMMSLFPTDDWTGIAASGYDGDNEPEPDPAQPLRTTAKPMARLLNVPGTTFADDLVLWVDARANGGIEYVDFYCEGNKQRIDDPGWGTIVDANGNDQPVYGYSCTIDGDATRAITGTGEIRVYALAKANDATMQERVIGPFSFYPRVAGVGTTGVFDIELFVDKTQATDAGLRRYQSVGAALNYLSANYATYKHPVVTFMHTDDYAFPESVTPETLGRPTWTVLRAADGVTATMGDGSVLRPSALRYDGLCFRGSGIKYDHAKWSPNFTGFVARSTSTNSLWFDGCEVFCGANSYFLGSGSGAGALYDAVIPSTPWIRSPQTQEELFVYFTECDFHDFPSYGPMQSKLVRNCTVDMVSGSVFEDIGGAVIGNTVTNMAGVNTGLRTELDAMTVTCSDANISFAIEDDPAFSSNTGNVGGSHRLFKLWLNAAVPDATPSHTYQINGVGSITSTPSSTKVADVVSWINGLGISGLSAVEIPQNRAATFLKLPGATATAPTRQTLGNKTFVTWVDVHGVCISYGGSSTIPIEHENAIFAFNSFDDMNVAGMMGWNDNNFNKGMDIWIGPNTFRDTTPGGSYSSTYLEFPEASHVCVVGNSTIGGTWFLGTGFTPDSYCLFDRNHINLLYWVGGAAGRSLAITRLSMKYSGSQALPEPANSDPNSIEHANGVTEADFFVNAPSDWTPKPALLLSGQYAGARTLTGWNV